MTSIQQLCISLTKSREAPRDWPETGIGWFHAFWTLAGHWLVTVWSAFHMFDYIRFMHVQYTHSSAGKYFHVHSKPNMWMLLTARLKTFVVVWLNSSQQSLNLRQTFQSFLKKKKSRLQETNFSRSLIVYYWATLTAMIWPVGLWTILLTEPYAPRPISPRSLRSSAVKSQCCSGEIFSFPDDSILCVRRRSLLNVGRWQHLDLITYILIRN